MPKYIHSQEERQRSFRRGLAAGNNPADHQRWMSENATINVIYKPVGTRAHLDSPTAAAEKKRIAQERIYKAIARKSAAWYRKDRQKPIRHPTPAESSRVNELRQRARANPRSSGMYNWEAANLIYQINNYKRDRNWDEIDLHGLSEREAIRFITDILQQFSDNPEIRDHEYLTVIVGKGIHSPNGPIIGPAIRQFLEKHGYEYWGGNSLGLVIVKLQRKLSGAPGRRTGQPNRRPHLMNPKAAVWVPPGRMLTH